MFSAIDQTTGKKFNLMAPYADMLNHGNPNNVEKHFNPEKQIWEMKAVTDIAKGDEVTLCYDEEASHHYFFCEFGFIMP